MDRRSKTLLCRAWDANAAAMGPALASTYVAWNADAWVSKLVDHVLRGSKTKVVLNCLEVIGKAAAYLADGAVETTAKSAALLNSARRVLWVKMWDGDYTSKSRLCDMYPLLFETCLEQVLSGKKDKKFPTKPKKDKGKTFFQGPPSKDRFNGKRELGKKWGFGKGKQKGGIFFWGRTFQQVSKITPTQRLVEGSHGFSLNGKKTLRVHTF